jgi:hypothetical protein
MQIIRTLFSKEMQKTLSSTNHHEPKLISKATTLYQFQKNINNHTLRDFEFNLLNNPANIEQKS